MSGPPPSAARHLPALDGVRGVAVSMVLALHTFAGVPTDTWYGRLLKVSGLGWVGVDLFFVLSGFLITGLLLDSRGSESYYRTFFTRRALRIWPLYFGMLAALTLVALLRPDFAADAGPAFLRNAAWYWTHTINFQIALADWTDATRGFMTGQFWSLAVEEQFYLVWPFVVARLGPRGLPRACAVLFVLALASRIGLVLTRDEVSAIRFAYTLPLPRLDGLLAGALLACAARDERTRARLFAAAAALAASPARLGSALTVWALALVVASGGIPGPMERWAWPVAWPPVAAFGGVLLLLLALGSPEAAFGGALLSRALRWVGGISYGLYALHPTMLWVVDALARHHAVPLSLIQERALGLALTFAVALISWHLWERPWLALRRRFPYGTGPTRPDRRPAALATLAPEPTRGPA